MSALGWTSHSLSRNSSASRTLAAFCDRWHHLPSNILNSATCAIQHIERLSSRINICCPGNMLRYYMSALRFLSRRCWLKGLCGDCLHLPLNKPGLTLYVSASQSLLYNHKTDSSVKAALRAASAIPATLALLHSSAQRREEESV